MGASSPAPLPGASPRPDLGGDRGPDPAEIATLPDLALALTRLRRRAARPGQVQLSVRDLATRTGRAASTLDPYLRGQRLCPADVYEEILRAVGVPAAELRPWLDAWDRLADARAARPGSAPDRAPEPTRTRSRRLPVISYTGVVGFSPTDPVPHDALVGIVTGDIRRVRCADVWVNSENTHMRMARTEEHSTSAVVRYGGAVRDETGKVLRDHIADELASKVSGRTPVAPGTAIITGPGELARSNGVRYVIHCAAVHGEPGEGYRQVLDVGHCASSVLDELERLSASLRSPDPPLRSVLFPLLGTGVGGGELEPTVAALLGAALDHLASRPRSAIRAIYFLAYTDDELAACQRIFHASNRLRPV